MKKCSRCAVEKDESAFYRQRRANDTYVYASHCKDCQRDAVNARLQALSPEQRYEYYEEMRARTMLRRFGISLEQYDSMCADQGGVCSICRQPETAIDNRWTGEGTRVRRLAVDHDHKTGENRGLLCMLCNTRLGYFEKHGLFPALLAYLEGEDL